MRVSNLLKHLSLFHVWWRSSVETCGGTTSRRERGSAAETAASRSRKRTQTCCYWQVLPFNHKSDFSLATVPQSIPTFGSLVGGGSHWSAEDFLHDGCGKVKTGYWRKEHSLDRRQHHHHHHHPQQSVCDCNHVFNALLQKPTVNNAIYHFSGLTKTADSYSELSLWARWG